MIVGGDAPGEIQLFTLGGPRPSLDGFRGAPSAISLSADDRLLAIASLTEPPQLFRMGVDALPHPQVISYLAIEPTGTRLATASSDAAIRVWDPRTSRSRQTIEVPAGTDLLGLAYAPDGTLAASSADGRIVVFHPDGRLRATLRIRADLYPGVPLFSPDGSLLTVITNWRNPADIRRTRRRSAQTPTCTSGTPGPSPNAARSGCPATSPSNMPTRPTAHSCWSPPTARAPAEGPGRAGGRGGAGRGGLALPHR